MKITHSPEEAAQVTRLLELSELADLGPARDALNEAISSGSSNYVACAAILVARATPALKQLLTDHLQENRLAPLRMFALIDSLSQERQPAELTPLVKQAAVNGDWYVKLGVLRYLIRNKTSTELADQLLRELRAESPTCLEDRFVPDLVYRSRTHQLRELRRLARALKRAAQSPPEEL